MLCPWCAAESTAEQDVCPSCGKGLSASGALPPGFKVADRFEVKRFLGEGGMGSVYEAYDHSLEERVALKFLKADFTRDPDMARRFRSEIKLARRLRHHNVCAIYEFREDGPHRYIAMELVEGTDLKRLLRDQGALETVKAFDVSIQIAHGLGSIHAAGVVHRDLKTSNVMLDSKGQVRLMDFGIAKQLGAEPTLAMTAVGNIIGTPEYMSPEQARGESIDFRSDLYSLGVVLYEIFTGHVPFRGDTPIATLFKNLQDPPTLEGPMARGIPESLKPVLLCSLAKSPVDRFATADEMAKALEAARDAVLAPDTASDAQPTLAVSEPTRTDAGATWHPPLAPTRLGAAVTAPTAPRQATPPRRPAARQPSPTAGTGPQAAPRRGSGLAVAIVGGLVILFVGMVALAVSLVPGLWKTPVVATESPAPEASPSLEPGPPIEIAKSTATIQAEAPPEPSPSPGPEETVGQLRPPPSPRVSRVEPPPRADPTPFTRRPTAPPEVLPRPGLLQLYIKPWAEVAVDDKPAGTTPLRPMSLAAGAHTVRLTHPAYRPMVRSIVIEPGGTTRLEIDLSKEGDRKE